MAAVQDGPVAAVQLQLPGLPAPVSPGAGAMPHPVPSPHSTIVPAGSGRKKNIQELVSELRGSSAVQLKLLEEIAIVRTHMTDNTGVAVDAHNVLQKTLGPLMQDLHAKNTVINSLMMELEDKNGLIKVLRRDLDAERANVMMERARAEETSRTLSRVAGDLDEQQMRQMPVDALVARIMEAQTAAMGNFKIAEETKQKLAEVTNELIRLKDAEQSMALLRRGVTEQSQYILKLQDAIKLHEKRYEEAKDVAENQEKVIQSMESVMDASALESAAQVVSSLRMKLLAAQRREDDAQRELDTLKAHAQVGEEGYDRQMREVQEELGRMDEELFGGNKTLERLNSLGDFVRSQGDRTETPAQTERDRIVEEIHAIKAKCKAEWQRQVEATRGAQEQLDAANRRHTDSQDAYARLCGRVTDIERVVKRLHEDTVGSRVSSPAGGGSAGAGAAVPDGSPPSKASSRKSSRKSSPSTRNPLARGRPSSYASQKSLKLLSSLHDPDALCDTVIAWVEEVIKYLANRVGFTDAAAMTSPLAPLHQDANAGGPFDASGGGDDGARVKQLQEENAALEGKWRVAQREVDALQSNVDILHEQGKEREKASAKEITALKMKLMEAKSARGRAGKASSKERKPKKDLDPIAPKNRFEGGDPHGRAKGWKG